MRRMAGCIRHPSSPLPRRPASHLVSAPPHGPLRPGALKSNFLAELTSVFLLCLTSLLQGAITDSVDFNSGALTDRFAINVETAMTNPYSLAANGLAGTQGVDLAAGGDATLVCITRNYNLSVVTSLDVSCFFKKQATSSSGGTNALTFALVGASGSRVNAYDASGTTEDSYVSLRLGRSSTSLRFETQSKAGNTTTTVTGNQSGNLSLTDGNWYQFRATFQRLDATTVRVSGSVYNSDASGNVGTLVSSYSAVNLSVADIAGDSQVWVALRGFATAGADALDNLAITANGVSEALPDAPSGLTATPLPGNRVALAWTDASNNEDNFIVSRATSAFGTFTDIATLLANTTSFTDDTGSVPARFFYKVRAVNSIGPASTGAVEVVTFRTRYVWRNAAIGGGGYVTGIFIHPLEANVVYVRTDVGGFYRWDAVNTRWIPITDHFTLSQSGYYGGEALALDPQNTNVVYIACGSSLAFGAVFKSIDRGATWTQLPLANIQMHGNGTFRASGERLMVSPNDSNLILFGTRSQGIQRSTDGGATWAKMTNLPDSAWTAGDGVIAIRFDPQNAGVVYASAPGSGVWRSADNGATWSLLPGSPTDAMRMAIGTSGALLVTHGAGVGKYAAGSWITTVPGGTVTGFRGISVNPANRDDVIVADTSTSAAGAKTYRSADGGATWTLFTRTKTNLVPWFDSFRRNNPALASMEFDPAVPGRVWLSDWYGVWRTDDINAASPNFTNNMSGLEENVVFTLAAPATGVLLLSGVADNDGFRHANGLDAFPSSRMTGTQDTHSLAVYPGDPSRIIRASGGRSGPYNVSVSTNGGTSWTNTAWSTAVPGSRALTVAIAATDPNNFVAATDSSLDGTARVTLDGGATWQAVTGLPVGANGVFSSTVPLAADPVLADTFYYHDAATGKLHRSTDKGVTFIEVNAGNALPVTSSSINLKTLPGTGGDVWTSLDTLGLYRSVNGGASFGKISSVTRAYRFAFGKAPVGSSNPVLFLYGSVTNSSVGVFRSFDLGTTWSELTDLAEAMGDGPNVMEGSAQESGLLFIGTFGRGVFYGRPVPTVSITGTAGAAELGPVPGSFTIARDGDTTAALPFAFSLGGAAISGTDYTTPSTPLTIPATAASASLSITPITDTIAEGPESVTLSLTPSPNYLIGPDATLTIADLPFDNWRATWFTFAELNTPSISGDLADPNANGINNLLEYALNGTPKGPSLALRPQVELSANHLLFSFSRNLAIADLTYIVQGSDDLVSWTDLTTATGGGAWTILLTGAGASETGPGSLKTATITDPVPGDTSHRTRFLRLKVTR